MKWYNKSGKELMGSLFKPKSPGERTVRKAVDFCVVQIGLLVFSLISIKERWLTLQMLCILGEIFEWRFYHLSMRLRRYEEDLEHRQMLRERNRRNA